MSQWHVRQQISAQELPTSKCIKCMIDGCATCGQQDQYNTLWVDNGQYKCWLVRWH